MKNLVLFMLILSFMGCGVTKPMTPSQIMAKENYKEMKERHATYYNKQSNGPKFKQLKQYAVSERSRYLHNLIYLYNKNPNLILSKLADPMNDPKAKKIADQEFIAIKRALKKMRKQPSMSSILVTNMMKEAKKSRYNPFWLITELPQDAKIGIIKTDGQTVIVNDQKIGGNALLFMKFISLNNEPLEKVMANIVTDLEAFLLHDSGWSYHGNGIDVLYAMVIKDSIALMNQSKLELTEITGNSEYDETSKKLLKLKIEKKENEIISYRKIIKNGPKNKKIYMYIWGNKSIPNTFSISVEKYYDHVLVFFAKRS